MNRIGIMQGRLVPPVEGRIQCFPVKDWAEEFPRAQEAGLSCIEWIFDLYGENANPLATDAGLAQLQQLIARHNVTIRSVCADYFMDRPFVGATPSERMERSQKLEWLMTRGAPLGVNRIVLPFVDQSSLRTAADREVGAQAIRAALPTAKKLGIEIHLETDMGPADFAAFLKPFPAEQVKVNYDSGNSASLGYRPSEEFAAYGDRVGSVHIKDRVRGGTTVALETGDTDFDDLFSCLSRISYAGDYILQVARGVVGEEVSWAIQNRLFVERRLGRVSDGLAARG